MLTRVPMLAPSACASVLDGVTALRDRWTRRTTSGEFYTLGAASYMDDGEGYAALAADRNAVLARVFAPLYDELLSRLGAALGAPAHFTEDKALPGFHIWGVPGIPTSGAASLHFDLQYEKHAWPEPVSQPMSFTLPLALPVAGGGLSMWDLTHERVMAFYARAPYHVPLAEIAALVPERHEPYAVGELVLHSGHTLHRIAGTPAIEPDDMRITLQGHGVFCGGTWHIYW
ncbi:MAG TPA: hypothetical protein VGM88_30440 [Kofleriaceae bacterium]|jgi:hypothetical protein